MRCPDDGASLAEHQFGVFSCRRCRGRMLTGQALQQVHPGIRDVLHPEVDTTSGAFARVRTCPQCDQRMAPLRIHNLLAWLDSCEACDLLWSERLDELVVQGFRDRRERERAIAALTPDERRDLVEGITWEFEQETRERRDIERIVGIIETIFDALS